jgi:hypothetical protein
LFVPSNFLYFFIIPLSCLYQAISCILCYTARTRCIVSGAFSFQQNIGTPNFQFPCCHLQVSC